MLNRFLVKKINGFFILALALFAVSCKKENNSAGPDNAPYVFSATIAGKQVRYEADDLNSRYSCGISSPANYSLENGFDIYEGTVFVNQEDETRNNIYVHLLQHFATYPSTETRLTMFRTGSYGYGYSYFSPETIDGASIHYTDENGKEWFSENGAQDGSSFVITEMADNAMGTSLKLFDATFNCILYDEDGLTGIQVTNAHVRGKVLLPKND